MKLTVQQNHLVKPFVCLFWSIVLISSTAVYGQQDFNKFRTLESVGPIPADFTTKTSDKIMSDIAGERVQMETSAEEKLYLESIHGQIDKLLFSGSVIYGDEISQYVQSIAAKLLKDEPELLASLRFYTIKSNETNALSTDQGIVFVTTGLITQLSSEAQLAFVLSHEISHYDERHVLESYEFYKTNNNRRNNIEKLSTHSKENELEADKLAIKRYHAAGYSVNELISAFDVLMYSYLPFDDIKFPRDYFNTASLYVPEKMFGDKVYAIKAEEDYNDSRSSHPNIKKRKDAINETIKEYSNWGSEVNFFGEEKFNYIRSVSRFESLRTNIIDAELAEALYSIFLLEQEFKDSEYLKHMKALVWLTMIQLNVENDLSKILPSSSHYEGESGNLYYMIRKLKDEELCAIGLRTIYDLQKANQGDEFLAKIYDRLLETLANEEKFKLDKYASTGFHEAASAAILKAETTVADTTKTEASKSKYDKIKSKKTTSTSLEVFDSTNFAYYAIPDIIADSSFLAKNKTYKAEADSMTDLEDAFADLPYSERKKLTRLLEIEAFDQGADLQKYILVEPTIEFHTSKKKTAEEKETIQQQFETAITGANDDLGLDMTLVSQTGLNESTDIFNERNVYISFLEEAANYGNIELFPVDYYKLQDLTNARGTSTLVFTTANYSYNPDLNPFVFIISAVFFPTLPITLTTYLPAKLVAGQHTTIRTIVFDTNKGGLLTFEQETIISKPRKKIVGAYYYQLLNKLKKSAE